MVTKILSLTAAITTVDLAARSQMDPGAPVYYFASSQLWVNIILVILAGLAVWISFKPKSRFSNWYSYAGCLAAAAFLMILGGLGAFYSNFRLDGWDLLLPLNYLILLEYGMVLAISGLSYKHPKQPANVRQLVAWAVDLPKAPSLAAANGLKTAYQTAKSSIVATTQPQRRAGVS